MAVEPVAPMRPSPEALARVLALLDTLLHKAGQDLSDLDDPAAYLRSVTKRYATQVRELLTDDAGRYLHVEGRVDICRLADALMAAGFKIRHEPANGVEAHPAPQ